MVLCMSVIPSFASERASSWNGNADSPYEIVNGNKPYFTDAEKKNTKAFETYSNLDSLGRCGVAYANICKEIMPTDEREGIGSVKPTGWQTPSSKYDFISGQYLYNRCHLIAYELAGENANKKNLITGTRYLNIVGMLPYENDVAKYCKKTGNHCLYRATPIFAGNNLLAEGVRLEGWSVEDNGKGICFNVFCYNVQPGVKIDYATGKNWAEESSVGSYDDPFFDDTNNDSKSNNVVVSPKTSDDNLSAKDILKSVGTNTTKKKTIDKNVDIIKKANNNTNSENNFWLLVLIFVIIVLFSRAKKGKSNNNNEKKKDKKE